MSDTKPQIDQRPPAGYMPPTLTPRQIIVELQKMKFKEKSEEGEAKMPYLQRNKDRK